MRVPAIGTLVAALAAGSALGQALLCPPSGTPQPCEKFHYHVQMYRPDTRGFILFDGINDFATMNACEQAHEAAVQHNAAIVAFYRKRNDQRYEPDTIGPCHCDTTNLNDAARNAQLRLLADTRMRVRERLMDANVPTDSELMRAVDAVAVSPLGGPKLVPLPEATPVASAENAPSDLRLPKPAELEPSPVSDLPLVEVVAAPPEPAPASPAQPEMKVEEPAPIDDPAEAFISVETERIQKVLAASATLNDVKVLEACSKRLQLLSNLRTLIESAGATSRLALAARAARNESDRLALVAKLFGSDMPAHWAPRDARDVVVDLVAEPEKVLRNPQASADDKRHALYAFLATSTPTDEQQTWLASAIEALL
jgi:hypothetical protein